MAEVYKMNPADQEEFERLAELNRITQEENAARKQPRLMLNPDAPYDSAKELLKREYRAEDGKGIIFQSWQKRCYDWNATHYEEVDEEILEGVIRNFLDKSYKHGAKGVIERFMPKQAHVNEVDSCLRTGAALPRKCIPPMWLDTPRSL